MSYNIQRAFLRTLFIKQSDKLKIFQQQYILPYCTGIIKVLRKELLFVYLQELLFSTVTFIRQAT